MAFHHSFNLANPSAIKSFLETAITSNGYTKDYEVGDYVGFKKKNFINALTGTEAYFIPIFLVRAGEVGVTLAKSTTPTTADGIIPEVNMPILSSLVFPLDAFMTVTDTAVVFCCRDSNNVYKTLVCATVDYRYLKLDNIAAVPLHEENLKNNSQCVFDLNSPSSGRILYAGTTLNQTLFNAQIDLDYISLNDAPASFLPKNSQTGLRPIACSVAVVKAFGTSNKVFGVLSGTMLSESGSFFPLDNCRDRSAKTYRVFKDSASGRSVVTRETN